MPPPSVEPATQTARSRTEKRRDSGAGAGGGSNPSGADESDAGRARFQLIVGRDLVALGFLLVLAAFVVAVSFLTAATDIAAAIGPVTTLVGTLVGAVFGVQVGNEGRQRESEAREVAETRAAQAAALVDPARHGEMLVRIWNGNPTEEDF